MIDTETTLIRNEVQATANLLAAELDSGMRSRITALERMGQRWENSGGTPINEWAKDANNYIEDQPGFQAIEWVNSEFLVQWVVPIEGNEAAIGLDLAFEQRRLEALESARDGKEITVTRTIELVQGGLGFLVYMPLFLEEESNFDGFLLGVYVVDEIFSEILTEFDGHRVEIYEGDTLIYAANSNIEIREDMSGDSVENLFGIEWTIMVYPGIDWLERQHTIFPNTFLLFGTVISALLGLSFFSIYQSRILRGQLEEALDSVQHLARTDPMTGLFNRRGILDVLSREFSRNKRFENPFAIALFDLDGLKKINDEKGHNVGDEAINAFGSFLKAGKRDYDWAGRYGGDEFLAIFPGLAIKDLPNIERRLRDKFEELTLAGNAIPEFSIGWAISNREIAETTLEMIERADKALYADKRRKDPSKAG